MSVGPDAGEQSKDATVCNVTTIKRSPSPKEAAPIHLTVRTQRKAWEVPLTRPPGPRLQKSAGARGKECRRSELRLRGVKTWGPSSITRGVLPVAEAQWQTRLPSSLVKATSCFLAEVTLRTCGALTSASPPRPPGPPSHVPLASCFFPFDLTVQHFALCVQVLELRIMT